MIALKKRRSLALLLGAVLVAVPVSSFAAPSVDTGSPSAPNSSDAGPGSDSGSPYESEQGTEFTSGHDTGTPIA